MKTNNNGPRNESGTESQDDSDNDRSHTQLDSAKKLQKNCSVYFQNIKIKGYDTTDALPKELNFSFLDAVGIIISICSFILDLVFDILLVYTFSFYENKLYFNLTLIFVAVPSLAMTGFSLRWYLDDADNKKMPPVSPCRWAIRIIFLVLQLGPVLRYIDSLYYGLKSNKYKDDKQKQIIYYKHMIYEDADATLLRLFECFLEAAPQLLLQLYIFAQPEVRNGEFNVTAILQLISMLSSLTSMSWALASYQRALRYSLEEKLNMTWCGSIAQILWHFFDISSRVIALGLFAAVFPLYFAFVCLVHYIVMVAWILIMRTTFCENKCEEFFYNVVLGFVFIFCYFNPKDSPTRHRYFFFYTCTFLENTLLMIFWFMNTSAEVSFTYPALVLQLTTFIFGIIIMVVYYMILHPNKNSSSLWAYFYKEKDVNVTYPPDDYTMKEITLSIAPSENA